MIVPAIIFCKKYLFNEQHMLFPAKTNEPSIRTMETAFMIRIIYLCNSRLQE